MAEHGHEDARMAVDDLAHLQETQPSTQNVGLNPSNPEAHLWGFLQPVTILTGDQEGKGPERMDFWKMKPSISIGRGGDANDFILPGFKVSNKHCRITWDGVEERNASVTVTDLSSNGTFINNSKIGRGNTNLIKDGQEIAFGTAIAQSGDKAQEDYRYVFRLIAAGPATEGLYAFYDVSHELGRGSFATVMKALHRSTGKWYAVKMIHEHKVRAQGNDTSSNKFQREISILQSLKHPNVCTLKEVFYQEGNINLVLEYVAGGDLLDYILKRKGLNEHESKLITYQLCDALAYIHSQGITHRDLKPENVLITADNPPVVKVADFGLAKVVDSMTALRTMCGTPSYLAPEVVLQLNSEGYDHLVDSWSVGVIVFSMLTGASPFIEQDVGDIKTRIETRVIDWDLLREFHDHTKNFIERLLNQNPQWRMTLDKARRHQWFTGYADNIIDYASTSNGAPDAAEAPLDMSMAEMSQSRPPDSSTSQQVPHRNARAPIQRRAYLLAQAAEEDGPSQIPEPTAEMLAKANNHYGERNGDPRHVLTPPRSNGIQNADSVEMADPEATPQMPSLSGKARRVKASSMISPAPAPKNTRNRRNPVTSNADSPGQLQPRRSQRRLARK